MMNYDVILIHPPAIYDFRKQTLFPSAIGSTVEQTQYIKVPIGMLSIADYLDRHGCRVIIDNLADRMVNSKGFDAEKHIENLSAKVYAIDLHFMRHAPGAIEVARLCKKLHPESLVVLGGLTATCFHEEIIKKYDFVDAVIRAEGEKPFLEFIQGLEKYGRISDTPNLTYRTEGGKLRVTPLMEPSESLDEFEYTRYDLLEPCTSVFSNDSEPRGMLIVCRGCIHNCVTCGASAYSYEKYLERKRPAFRSPAKIAEDIRKLNEQGIRLVGLFQDPRMGGEKYWRDLFSVLRSDKLDIECLSMDIFTPVNEEFVREVAAIGKQVVFYICPDSGTFDARKAQGRNYSNDELLNTIELCYRYNIPVTLFLSAGLAGETCESTMDTWRLWEKFCLLNRTALTRGKFKEIGQQILVGGPVYGPIIIDPGSLAFDFPEKYGYRMLFKNLEEFVDGFSKPSWHQWLNYETDSLSRDDLTNLALKFAEFSIIQRERYGLYDKYRASLERFQAKLNKIAVEEVDSIMKLQDGAEREKRLKTLRETIDSSFNSLLREYNTAFVEKY